MTPRDLRLGAASQARRLGARRLSARRLSPRRLSARHGKARDIARACRYDRIESATWGEAARRQFARSRSVGAQADFANFSTASVTRAVIGAIACSVSLNEASVSLPDSASVFSIVARARLACRSNASFNDFTEVSALNVDTVSSNDACAVAAICF